MKKLIPKISKDVKATGLIKIVKFLIENPDDKLTNGSYVLQIEGDNLMANAIGYSKKFKVASQPKYLNQTWEVYEKSLETSPHAIYAKALHLDIFRPKEIRKVTGVMQVGYTTVIQTKFEDGLIDYLPTSTKGTQWTYCEEDGEVIVCQE